MQKKPQWKTTSPHDKFPEETRNRIKNSRPYMTNMTLN
jgi:hypothetical protein